MIVILIGCTPIVNEVKHPTPGPTITPSFPTAPTTVLIGDGGVITGRPCASPCFFGILVGQTPIEKVISTLEENGLSPCIQNEKMTILCGDNFIGADPETHLVNGIGYYPDSSIYVEEIILEHGAPDSIQVIPTGIPEAPKIVVLLLFDTLKMRIILPEIDGREYSVTSSTKIELVNYFDDTIYAEINGDLFSQSWKGYTTYTPDQ